MTESQNSNRTLCADLAGTELELGAKPLANLTTAGREHQVTFRHPQFGEHTETFIVRPATLTRVSATLAQ